MLSTARGWRSRPLSSSPLEVPLLIVSPFLADQEAKTFGDCGNSYAYLFFLTFVLVCGNMMLNLFIGMILDNFSFITDEVAQEEDQDWTTGASAEQVRDIARTFMLFDRGTTCLPLSSLHPMLRLMPKPLGFMEKKKGVALLDPHTKVAELMVRAEVNILLYKEWQARRKIEKMSIWQRVLRCQFMPRYKARFAMCVSFDDCAMTLLYWRKPDMVPQHVKIERYGRVQETLLMANALIITDFFRRIVSRRKQADLQHSLKARVRFADWRKQDVHGVRRNSILLDIKQEHKTKEKAKTLVDAPPLEESVSVEVLKITEVPPGLELHQVALDAHNEKHNRMITKPMHGIEVFLERSQKQIVAVRFLDPLKADRVGTALIDLRRVDFRGWVVRNLTLDSFFEPQKMQDQKSVQAWMQVDFRRKTRQSVCNPRYEDMGSLLDVTACVEVCDVASLLEKGEFGQIIPKPPVSVQSSPLVAVTKISGSASDGGSFTGSLEDKAEKGLARTSTGKGQVSDEKKQYVGSDSEVHKVIKDRQSGKAGKTVWSGNGVRMQNADANGKIPISVVRLNIGTHHMTKKFDEKLRRGSETTVRHRLCV